MKKCIYKITNIINGKSYIGQTNDFKRRQREHKNCMYGTCNKVLYNAIQKYGFDNFIMEQIEDYIENYNEKEQYWINYYNTLTPNGYNVDLTLAQSENNIYIDDDTLLLIYQDLKEEKLTYDEITEKYNFRSSQSIRNINKGITHHKNNVQYPIRQTRNEIANKRAIQIINDLKTTNMNFSDIAKKYNCSSVLISNINTGTRCHQDNEIYPIRKNTRKSQKFTEETIDQIYNDIINTKLKWTELAKKYHCGDKVFQHINQGIKHRREGYNYPLRKGQNIKGAEKVPEIIHLLQTTNLSYAAIAKKLNTNSTTVANINKGKTHKQEHITYPIRK